MLAVRRFDPRTRRRCRIKPERSTATLVLAAMLLSTVANGAEDSRHSKTGSRSSYVHWIELYDAEHNKIDPDDPFSAPYSPAVTCGKCHEYQTMAAGHHFNAWREGAVAGRAGEPWIWVDPRTGTQLPLSYRAWPGTYTPEATGISAWQFVLKFGSHLPGGGPGLLEGVKETEGDDPASAGRWRLSGPLSIDCMVCHSNDRAYSREVWAKQIDRENFAWAPTAALGLAQVTGEVKRLKDDFEPNAAEGDQSSGPNLPQATYYQARFNADKEVFFDVVRTPPNRACYYCHTTQPVGASAHAGWNHDEDVHLEAGLSCVDCHRNGVGHHTVRGYDGEQHPTGTPVASLSCRGCHLGEPLEGDDEATVTGRLGSPKALHRGLPPLHLEKMSCTSCHCGPLPDDAARPMQTALAHGLGLPAHREADQAPGIVAPVFRRDDDSGVIYPYRMTWPAFWGALKDDAITPLNPEEVYAKLRRSLRVRRDFTTEVAKVTLSRDDKIQALGEERAKVAAAELTDDEKAKLDELQQNKAAEQYETKMTGALESLAEDTEFVDGTPVYVSAGKAHRVNADGKFEAFDHPAAQPYAWPLAHDVRPARLSLGSGGCQDCHADETPMFYGTVTATGPAPISTAEPIAMYEFEGIDAKLFGIWNQSFRVRTAFKWVAFVCTGVVALVLVLFLLIGLNGLLGFARRKHVT
jgi:hypothetical protein